VKVITNKHHDSRPFPDEAASTPPPTLIVGLGNDLVSDDGAGIYVARLLRQMLDPRRYEVRELAVGGIGLVDHLLGFKKAIIIDACQTGDSPPGTIFCYDPSRSARPRCVFSYHTLDFPTAIEFARRIGAELPEDIRVFAIEAEDVVTIRERCTPAVEAAIPLAAERIVRFLETGEDVVSEESLAPLVE